MKDIFYGCSILIIIICIFFVGKEYKKLSKNIICFTAKKVRRNISIIAIESIICIAFLFSLWLTYSVRDGLRIAIYSSLLFVLYSTFNFLLRFYLDMKKMSVNHRTPTLKREKTVRLYCWIVGSISGAICLHFITLHYTVSLVAVAIGLIKCIQIGLTKKSLLEKMNR